MKFNLNFNSRSFRSLKIKAVKSSPTILLVAGIGTGVFAGYKACKATLKAEKIYHEYKEKREIIEAVHDDPLSFGESQYTEEDYSKDVRDANIKLVVGMVKNYSVPLLLASAAVSMITGSHVIMHKRCTALTGTVISLTEALRQYRKNVVDELGEEADHRFANNIKEIEIEDPETKEKKKVKKSINNKNPFAFWFGPTYKDNHGDEYVNPYWSNDAQYNIAQLKRMMKCLNDQLKSNENLFVNEVFDSFAIPRTSDGGKFGWIYEKNNPYGDNYIDFRIDESEIMEKYRRGITEPILIDLNVDGYILDRI